MSAIRVLVVDDQALFREGLVTLLGSWPEFDVVGQAADGAQALASVVRWGPDVVLMDLRMPNMDGVAATRRIRAEHPDTKVVVLTTFDDDDCIFDALRAGALGYLLKDASSEQLAEAVRLAARGQSSLAPEVATRVVQGIARPPRARPGTSPLTQLTPREREVLALIAGGAANKDIARCLGLAPGTVKNHITSLLGKLDVADRLQAALLAREHGITRDPG